MSRQCYPEGFKIEAVKQVTEKAKSIDDIRTIHYSQVVPKPSESPKKRPFSRFHVVDVSVYSKQLYKDGH